MCALFSHRIKLHNINALTTISAIVFMPKALSIRDLKHSCNRPAAGSANMAIMASQNRPQNASESHEDRHNCRSVGLGPERLRTGPKERRLDDAIDAAGVERDAMTLSKSVISRSG